MMSRLFRLGAVMHPKGYIDNKQYASISLALIDSFSITLERW